MATCRNPSKSTAPDVCIVGVDDGAFRARRKGKQHTLLVAVLFQNFRILDVRVGRIQVDGTDANHVLGSLLKSMRFDVTMLSGISFGGFNLIDMGELVRATHKPVVAISGEKPDNNAVRRALRSHFSDWKERWRMVRAAGKLYSCKPLPNEPKLYFEVRGASPLFAKRVILLTARISRLPEPVRVARILARGLSELVQFSSR